MAQITKDKLISQDAIDAFKILADNVDKSVASIERLIASGKKTNTILETATNTRTLNTETEKLTDSQKELEKIDKRLQAEMVKGNQAVINKTAALKKLQKENRDNIKDINNQNDAYKRLESRLNKVREDYKNIAAAQGINSREARKLNVELKSLDGQLKKIDGSAGQFQRNVGNYKQAFKGAITSIVAWGVAIGAAVRFIGKAVKITRDYEDANAVLNGILRKTAKETQLLRNQQLELGSATEFSASEVAKAQTELARLGVTQDNIIQMTPGILAAATALGTDLASASTLVAGTLNAFQLEASDSVRVADVLTKATQISALNFDTLSSALAVAAPAAKAVNVPLEELTATLGVAADNNIDAAKAANALKNIFIILAEKGLSFDDAMKQINTSQDKLKTSSELFGKEAALVGLVISENTEKIKANTESLKDAAGTADEFAKKQLETLSGKLKLLNSAWEGFILSIENGEGVLGSVLKGTIDALTTMLGLLGSAELKIEEIKAKAKDSLLGRNAIEEVKQLREEFELLSKSGGTLTIEELAIQKIEQLSEGAKKLQSNYSAINSELTEQEAKLKSLTTFNQEFVDTKNRINTLKKENEASKTQLDIQNSSIEALKSFNDKAKETPEIIKETVTELKIVSAAAKELKEMEPLIFAFNEKELLDGVSNVLNKSRDLNMMLSELNQGMMELGEGGSGSGSMSEDTSYLDQLEMIEQFELMSYSKRIKHFKALQDALKSNVNLGEKEKFELYQEYAQKIADLESQSGQGRIEKIQQLVGDIAFIIEETFNKSLQIVSDMIQGQLDFIDSKLNGIEERRNYELEQAGRNAEERIEIEKRFNEEEKKLTEEKKVLQRKQALANKALAISQAIISTAVGVANALALPFAGIPLAITIGAIGAAQIAAIIAAPIPQFAKGIDSSPEGLAIVNDGNGQELLEKNGRFSMVESKGSTLTYLQKGTKVHTAEETQSILSSGVSGGISIQKAKTTEMYQNAMVLKGLNDISKNLKNQKQLHVNMSKRGVELAIRSGHNITKLLNSDFK